MKDLEGRQHEMQQRMKKPKRTAAAEAFFAKQAEVDIPARLLALERRLAALQEENARLRAENQRLRAQKTVYVERSKSADELRREQQHNYFKYSNARRW